MKVWLDDIRDVPDDSWTWVKTCAHARTIFRSVPVDAASLDHDLGLRWDFEEEESGYDMLLWIVEEDCWPSQTLAVHSANVVGIKAMCAVIERYGPYDEKEFIQYTDTLYDAILYSKSGK